MNNQTTNGRIAQAIKKARLEAGLTQVQLAERVASIKDATVVSKIENLQRMIESVTFGMIPFTLFDLLQGDQQQPIEFKTVDVIIG